MEYIFNHSFMAINLHVSKLMKIKEFEERTPAFEVNGGYDKLDKVCETQEFFMNSPQDRVFPEFGIINPALLL